MKGSVIALDEIAGRKAAAHLVDGQLDDLLIAPKDDSRPLPGAIYRAVCDRPVKGQGGMFVKLPEGGSGFLRGAKGLKPGQTLLVQVTGWAEDGKATPVTDRILFKSRNAIVTPGAPGINVSRRIRDEEARVGLLEIAHEVMGAVEGVGLILRSVAAEADEAEVAGDIAAMRDLAAAVMADVAGAAELLVEGPDPHELAWRDWANPEVLADAPGSFAVHGINEMISTLQRAELLLSGGALAFIEPTRALVAVDVNTGADTSPAAGLKANIALARALPRQLRCRGLGGQITLDVAPMPKKDRLVFEQSLRAAFRSDAVETALAGWTPLGHFELQRKRERLPLDL
jgi:Ribonuclease G/E